MNVKKVFKIIAWVVLSIIMLAAAFFGIVYYQSKSSYDKKKVKFLHEVGYIDQKKAKFSDGFSLCDSTYSYGYYSSAAPKIYKGTKYAFRKMIHEKYKNINYLDTGFLNLRFHINCLGKVGNLEINELNTKYEVIDLNDTMVNHLVELSLAEENWNSIIQNGINRDVYMYLIYKIENGDVVEILP